jgi:hypothetical protein
VVPAGPLPPTPSTSLALMTPVNTEEDPEPHVKEKSKWNTPLIKEGTVLEMSAQTQNLDFSILL